MDEFIKILRMTDSDISNYVNEKVWYMDSLTGDYDDISLGDDGIIYDGWISTQQVYKPSGNRSMGFKMTKQFYIDWCNYIRNTFGKIDISKLASKMDNSRLIQIINMYINLYFGDGYDETKRKRIYGYGNWQLVGDTINIDSLRNMGVARCIEKSAAFNGIANFIGIDSSLVLSDSSLNNGERIGHAYCMLKLNNDYFICDPNFYGTNTLGKGIPFIFKLDLENESKVTFDSSKFGDIDSKIVEYIFPWHELNKSGGKIHK